MSTGYRIYNGSGFYFMTWTIVQWADLLSRKRYRDIICDSLNYCTAHKGLRVYGYCIMTNHVHILLSAVNGNLSDVLRDCKAHISRTLMKSILEEPESRRDWLLMLSKYAAGGHNRNRDYQLWEHDNHAIEIYSETFLLQKLGYIHDNPVRAGFVAEGHHWLYSSAADYYNGRQVGPVQVQFIF